MPSTTTTFEVTGDNRLNCGGCEQRVSRLLKALPGVDEVNASARTQRIDVRFDAAALTAQGIAERLQQAGYQTRVV
jgi:copper chaperone